MYISPSAQYRRQELFSVFIPQQTISVFFLKINNNNNILYVSKEDNPIVNYQIELPAYFIKLSFSKYQH